MSGVGGWSYKVDGTELNDGVNYLTTIPELETTGEDDVILVPVDGRAPAYIRNQPKEVTYSLLVAVINAGAWATWASRRAALFALLTNGPHTLVVQARGMSAPVTTTIIVRGKIVAAKERRIAVSTIATVPLF